MNEQAGALDRRQLRPIDHAGLVRLGLHRDGGYVVPEAQVKSATVLLSLGMKDDWSFDRDFVRANAVADADAVTIADAAADAAGNGAVRVIAVDGSVGSRFFLRQIRTSLVRVVLRAIARDRRGARRHVAALRNAADYFRFFRCPHRHIRKMAAGADGASTVTLKTLLEMGGAVSEGSVFLKMDIEGAEYALVPDIVRHHAWFSAIVVEFHGVHRRAGPFNQAMQALLAHFYIVHVHGNNYSRYDPAHDFPGAVAITFVSKALIPGEPAPSPHAYPRVDLDYPNFPGRPDHQLRFE